MRGCLCGLYTLKGRAPGVKRRRPTEPVAVASKHCLDIDMVGCSRLGVLFLLRCGIAFLAAAADDDKWRLCLGQGATVKSATDQVKGKKASMGTTCNDPNLAQLNSKTTP